MWVPVCANGCEGHHRESQASVMGAEALRGVKEEVKGEGRWGEPEGKVVAADVEDGKEHVDEDEID